MCFVNVLKLACIGMLASLLAGCGGLGDDLQPTGQDQRQAVVAGTIGSEVTQVGPDFTLSDTLDVALTLSSEVQASRAVVLYFTMWCSTCDEHMHSMRTTVVKDFPDVSFLLVDYVMGTVPYSRAAQLNAGYGDFRVLVDGEDGVENAYKATMGTTIVIDSLGVVRMNEDYKNGAKLKAVLEAL